MNEQHVAYLLIAFFASAFIISTISIFLRSNTKLSWSILVVCSIGLILSSEVGANLTQGSSFFWAMIDQISRFSRVHIAALGLGASAALPFSLLWNDNRRLPATTIASVAGIFGVFVFGGSIAAKSIISPYLPHPGAAASPNAGRLAPPGFIIEDVAESSVIPIRVAVGEDGRVYTSGHSGIAAQSGGVFELVTTDSGATRLKQIARMLNRPYGLLPIEGGILVSRSGQYAKWNRGKAENISTGAVTLLKDLDGDGIMDYYHDILTDMPGARAPDYLHQNNDLAIDSEGNLYVTNAFNSDAHPGTHPWEGTLLRLSGDEYSDVEVWSTGLRNVFGLAFGPGDRLYASDNDPQSGSLRNLGDKLVEISKGADYGHPYRTESDPSVGRHLLRSEFALGGLTYAKSSALPEPYKDSLYVVSYGEGRIMRVNFQSESTSGVALEPFVTIPGAVDVAAAPNGDFYVAVYPDKLVRVRYSEDES